MHTTPLSVAVGSANPVKLAAARAVLAWAAPGATVESVTVWGSKLTSLIELIVACARNARTPAALATMIATRSGITISGLRNHGLRRCLRRFRTFLTGWEMESWFKGAVIAGGMSLASSSGNQTVPPKRLRLAGTRGDAVNVNSFPHPAQKRSSTGPESPHREQTRVWPPVARFIHSAFSLAADPGRRSSADFRESDSS